MYKMMFVDLDGTLLNDSKKVSKEDTEAIKKAYTEKGIITVITTGRPEYYVQEIYESNTSIFADYIIACNGAIIKNQKTNDYLKNSSFSNEDIKNLEKIFITKKGNYLIMDSAKKSMLQKAECFDVKNIGISNSKNDINQNNIKDDIVSCTIGAELKALEEIRNDILELQTLEPTPICNYLYEENGKVFTSKYIDVIKAGCTKKNAIQILAEKFHIKQEEIIVIGDGGNDISMFEMAGLKIAMHNGEDCIKEKADYITISNNESGVAKAIHKFIFNEI